MYYNSAQLLCIAYKVDMKNAGSLIKTGAKSPTAVISILRGFDRFVNLVSLKRVVKR